MTDTPKPSVSERLLELAKRMPNGSRVQVNLEALATEIEEIAEMIRDQIGWEICDGDFGESHTYDDWADRLSPRKEGTP